MTLMALDVGNTRLKWASYSGVVGETEALAQGVEFLENIHHLADTAWKEMPEPSVIMGCAVAGDAVRRQVKTQLDFWGVEAQWVIPSNEEAGLSNGYDYPSRLGADRWVAMIGAKTRAEQQGMKGALLVVMVGTAVTVDAIDASGQFLGGIILPGHGIMLKSLLTGTAGLHVPTGEVKKFPTNTSDALTSGGTFAIAGAVQRMAAHLQELTGQVPKTYMTGGAAWKVQAMMGMEVELVESLIFDGLLEIANRRGLLSSCTKT